MMSYVDISLDVVVDNFLVFTLVKIMCWRWWENITLGMHDLHLLQCVLSLPQCMTFPRCMKFFLQCMTSSLQYIIFLRCKNNNSRCMVFRNAWFFARHDFLWGMDIFPRCLIFCGAWTSSRNAWILTRDAWILTHDAWFSTRYAWFSMLHEY